MNITTLLRCARRFHLSAHRARFFSSKPTYSDYIGISFGSSNTYVAVAKSNGEVEVLESCPSVVAINKDSKVTVGSEALLKSVTDLENTITGINRIIGRKFDDPVVQNEMRNVSYWIVKEPVSGDPLVVAHEMLYDPTKIMAKIIQSQIKKAEHHCGTSFSNALITYPKGWDLEQLQALIQVGSDAGLHMQYSISEPTATAIGLGTLNIGSSSVILDLGHRTFDFFFMEKNNNGRYLQKICNNDVFLGGYEFDKVIMQFIFEKFKRNIGSSSSDQIMSTMKSLVETYKSVRAIDLKRHGREFQILRMAAEVAKTDLSQSDCAKIQFQKFNFLDDDKVDKNLIDTGIELSRSEFESMASHLLDRIRDHCTKSLEMANRKAIQVDEVYLLGGMAQVPCVQNVIKQVFGKSPIVRENPDEQLVAGAAVSVEYSSIFRAFHSAKQNGIIDPFFHECQTAVQNGIIFWFYY